MCTKAEDLTMRDLRWFHVDHGTEPRSCEEWLDQSQRHIPVYMPWWAQWSAFLRSLGLPPEDFRTHQCTIKVPGKTARRLVTAKDWDHAMADVARLIQNPDLMRRLSNSRLLVVETTKSRKRGRKVKSPARSLMMKLHVSRLREVLGSDEASPQAVSDAVTTPNDSANTTSGTGTSPVETSFGLQEQMRIATAAATASESPKGNEKEQQESHQEGMENSWKEPDSDGGTADQLNDVLLPYWHLLPS